MTDEKNQQELLFKFSMFEQQIKQIQQQLQAVEQGIVELSSLSFGLDELVGNTGKEIRAPIGRGIFVNAKLISEELIVDIGKGNLVKKSIPETKELIGEQIKKLEQVREELENNLNEVGRELGIMMGNSNDEHVHDENCEH